MDASLSAVKLLIAGAYDRSKVKRPVFSKLKSSPLSFSIFFFLIFFILLID